MSLTLRARLLVVASAALASTGGAAIKSASLGAIEVAGLRAAIAAVVLAALLRPPRTSWHGGTLAVGVVQGLMMMSFVAANKLTTAASAIYLQSTSPLYVLLLAPLLLGEPIRRRDLGYLVVLALGLAAFFVEADPVQETAPDPLLGNLIAAASGVGWALTILGFRWLAARAAAAPPPADANARARERDPAGAAAVLANALVFVACMPWIGATPRAALAADLQAIVWLGAVQVGLAYVCLTRGVRHLPAFETSLLLLVEPTFSPLWAWIALCEQPGRWALAGGAAIIGTTIVRSWRESR
jgi:drug/metabolite transporter (DMT)-like permease